MVYKYKIFLFLSLRLQNEKECGLVLPYVAAIPVFAKGVWKAQLQLELVLYNIRTLIILMKLMVRMFKEI